MEVTGTRGDMTEITEITEITEGITGTTEIGETGIVKGTVTGTGDTRRTRGTWRAGPDRTG